MCRAERKPRKGPPRQRLGGTFALVGMEGLQARLLRDPLALVARIGISNGIWKGVTRAVVDYDTRQAVVSFDDARTGVASLKQATADAGYPSTLKEPGK